MGTSKHKGQIAEVAVIRDSVERGYRVSLPMNEDCPYDLIVDRRGRASTPERVQCKYVESDGEYVLVRCRTSNRGYEIRYTSLDVDWIAAFDVTTGCCYYVPSNLLGPSGRTGIHLRLTPARNGQAKRLWWAEDFRAW